MVRRILSRGRSGRALTALLLALTLSMLASSCGEGPPPEGFDLRLRLTGLDPAVLDTLRVTFVPSTGGERFMHVEPMSFEDGAIDLMVATDGALMLTVDGAHVQTFAEDPGDGTSVYTLEVWSDDEQPRTPAPSVRVTGTRGGEAIAEGFLFLPQWPLPLGGSTIVQVECRAEAAAAGLCR